MTFSNIPPPPVTKLRKPVRRMPLPRSVYEKRHSFEGGCIHVASSNWECYNIPSMRNRELIFGDLLLSPYIYGNGLMAFRERDYKFITERLPQSKTVYYPGCGRDFTPIFAFKRAENLIYQDIGDFGFEPPAEIYEEYSFILRNLESRKLIRGLRIKKEARGRMAYEFEARDLDANSNKFLPKKLDLYHGPIEGDMRKGVPDNIKDVGVVYLRGMSLFPEVVPRLSKGTIIKSSTTIDSIGFFDPVRDEDVKSLNLEVVEIIDAADGIFKYNG